MAAIRPHIPEEVVAPEPFRRLQAACASAPASAANHEFGFEVRPYDPDRVDPIWGVQPGGTTARELVRQHANDVDNPVLAAAARFLAALHAEGPDFCRLINLLWVEVDVGPAGAGYAMGISAVPSVGFPHGRRPVELLAGLWSVADEEILSNWHFAARMVTGFVGPVLHAASFPARGTEGNPIRLIAKQTDPTPDIVRRLDWPGDAGQIDRLSADYPAADDRQTLSADFIAGGIQPRIGIEFIRPGGWTEMNPALWAIRLRQAAAAGFCSLDQAKALVSVIGSRIVETEAGPTAVNLGINNVKFVFGDGDPRMKVYLGGNMGQVDSAS